MAATPAEDADGSVLVTASSGDRPGGDLCIEAVASAPGETDALVVALTSTPNRWLERYRARVDRPPANLGFVTTEDTVRASRDSEGDIAVRTVSNPGDLTGLGMAISDYLSEWHGDGNRLVVCLGRLTPLFQYTDMTRLYRFLHVITQRIKHAGGVAYLYLDPAAHDEKTVATLRSLADHIVTPE